MNPGTLRHAATLTHPRAAPATWPCAIASTGGQVVDGLDLFMLRGRYHPAITLETQIVVGGRTYQVQHITDVDERHIELELLCVEVVARGREPASY